MKYKIKKIVMGFLFCSIIALISIYLSSLIGNNLFGLRTSPLSPIFLAIIIGMFIASTSLLTHHFDSGIKFCTNYILKLGIILMGIRLGLIEMLAYSSKSLIIVIPCIFLTLILVRRSANIFNLKPTVATLIAVGTSICGATAIVATAPTIKAKQSEVVFAVANITIFGIIAMFIYPTVATFLFRSDSVAAGIFLGSSIHETAQVAGAGMIYSYQNNAPIALEVATVTKLIRNTAMIIIIPILAYQFRSDEGLSSNLSQMRSIFPYFIIGFIILGIFRTFGDLGIDKYGLAYSILDQNNWEGIILHVNKLSKFLLIVAMSALGMSTNVSVIKSIGVKVFLYGLTMSSVVGIISVISIRILI